MTQTDPISNMLTQIKTSSQVGKDQIVIPYSQQKEAILKILKAKKKILDLKVLIKKKRKFLSVKLAYQNRQPAISQVRRISKPGLRVYARQNNIPFSKTGKGIVILTTSQGILAADVARKIGVGGEVICEVS